MRNHKVLSIGGEAHYVQERVGAECKVFSIEKDTQLPLAVIVHCINTPGGWWLTFWFCSDVEPPLMIGFETGYKKTPTHEYVAQLVYDHNQQLMKRVIAEHGEEGAQMIFEKGMRDILRDNG